MFFFVSARQQITRERKFKNKSEQQKLRKCINEGRVAVVIIVVTSNHRLNDSSSPVLTATCLSYGGLCDFLTFFPEHAWGQTPQPIFTQNGSNDVDSRTDVPFAVKIETF